jgi:hypothetical protein
MGRARTTNDVKVGTDFNKAFCPERSPLAEPRASNQTSNLEFERRPGSPSSRACLRASSGRLPIEEVTLSLRGASRDFSSPCLVPALAALPPAFSPRRSSQPRRTRGLDPTPPAPPRPPDAPGCTRHCGRPCRRRPSIGGTAQPSGRAREQENSVAPGSGTRSAAWLWLYAKMAMRLASAAFGRGAKKGAQPPRPAHREELCIVQVIGGALLV